MLKFFFAQIHRDLFAVIVIKFCLARSRICSKIKIRMKEICLVKLLFRWMILKIGILFKAKASKDIVEFLID